MFSTQLWKLVRVLLVALTACSCAFAQTYGGGGGTGTTGTPTTSRSYSHGAAIGAAVAAAAGATVLFIALHNRGQVVGCVGPDGKTLTTDKGKHRYQLVGTQMRAGEHLSMVGKKTKNAAGIDELQVTSVKKDLGKCEQ